VSLINYIEPVDVGSVFIGIGSLFVTLTIAYILFKLCRPIIKSAENIYAKELKYSIVEERILDEVAKEKGINLNEEILNRKIIDKPTKSFRKKVEEEVFERMFPNDEIKPITK